MTYLAMFGMGIIIVYISKSILTAPLIYTPTRIPMSAPLRRNPRRQCRNVLEPPIYISVRENLFDVIIDNLDSPPANILRAELRRLLHLRGDFARHLQITQLIGRLQHILRRHPRSRDFNYQLLYPAPRFDHAIRTRGPGYATGDHSY